MLNSGLYAKDNRPLPAKMQAGDGGTIEIQHSVGVRNSLDWLQSPYNEND